jgi:hypothetical protein
MKREAKVIGPGVSIVRSDAEHPISRISVTSSQQLHIDRVRDSASAFGVRMKVIAAVVGGKKARRLNRISQ